MWTETLLNLTAAEELRIATSDNFTSSARRAAYDRLEAKRWYEAVVLPRAVRLDLPDLQPPWAAEVVELRKLVGLTPPWVRKELAA